MNQKIPLVDELVDASRGYGLDDLGGRVYSPADPERLEEKRIAIEHELYLQFNSLRLIVRNARAEMGLRGNHWLLRDLKAAERWLNGETREITSEGL